MTNADQLYYFYSKADLFNTPSYPNDQQTEELITLMN